MREYIKNIIQDATITIELIQFETMVSSIKRLIEENYHLKEEVARLKSSLKADSDGEKC